MSETKHIIIIGGGPAGYVGAIRAAQLGARVTLVERSPTLGGTCLNVGCIPTKALLASAGLLREIRGAGAFGLKTGEAGFDWAAVQQRKDRVVRKATAGVGMLLKKRGVTVVNGSARLVNNTTVQVTAPDGKTAELAGDFILIATGSEPIKLPIPGADHPRVIDSTGALSLAGVPRRFLIIGGGVIGCELADAYSAFGSQVTIVELMPQLIPGEDADAVRVLQAALAKRGVEVLLEHRVTAIVEKRQDTEVCVQGKDMAERRIEVDAVMVAAGRKASLAGLGLDAAGVRTERGLIAVDGRLATSVPGICAAGDCTGGGGWLLAHVASRQAEVAVENLLGHAAAMDYAAVPRCVYTHPEIASVGSLRPPEGEAPYLTGSFPFSASGKASCQGALEGFVKVVADPATHEVRGAVIAGAGATELIAELSLAVSLKARLEDVAGAIHAHPTLHESTLEAALAALGRPVHL
ncbi:MAG: dihydrolipoyl dehydrogenase [Candidatus Edwardsbacteria bacterium]|jgi:dihydrolipoamide dehydrogenase|nr:dihydrolipoyl dehydrogenase [Candidatus Edwardsbacteria bacterium]